VAPLRGEKLDLYEGGIRVPLVVRWPGVVAAGSSSAVPVVGTDLYPTLLSAAGLELEAEDDRDGADLGPLLRGAGTLARERLCFFVPHRDAQASIREGDWKLLHWFTGKDELYDLASDPGETRDLHESDPARAKSLEAELLGWIHEQGAALPEPNAHYDPNRPRKHAATDDDENDEDDE